MPDTTVDTSGAAQFRFQPERPAFDTSSSSTPLTNTMSIRGDQATASLPAGVTGGFQVVEIDPLSFTVVKSDAIGSNGSWDGLGDVMIPRLNEIRDHGTGYVAVQSIGHPTPSSSVWPQVASAVAADPSDSFEGKLYDIALSPATPWPYTKAAGHPEADAYARALADITAKLPRLKSWPRICGGPTSATTT